MPIDTKELMRQVAKIKMITSRLVSEHLTGAYHAVFKGQGIEFEEVRDYVAGDDVRSIDWNVTARMGHPFVKRFREERELTVLFLVDVSGSLGFGSGTESKAEVAARITCLLALSAIRNQDKVGLILFSDRIEKTVPPRKGRTAVMRLVRDVLASEQTMRRTDIAAALTFLNTVHKRKAVVFLISDFQDTNYERELRLTARRHDLICCPVMDPREFTLPTVGPIAVEDPERGSLNWLDARSVSIRQAFAQSAIDAQQARMDLFRKAKIDTLSVSTSRPVIDDVRRLFRERQMRVRRRH